MSQLHLTDEILMAFADGELEAPVAAVVARAMADNRNVAKRIVDFQRSRRLTRSAFADVAPPEVPAELLAAVSARIKAYEAVGAADAGSDLPRARSVSRRNVPMQIALAASLAAIGLALGYFVGREERAGTSSLIAQLESPSVRRELSKTPSGSDIELPVGRMRVISTFRLGSGSLCREFKLRTATDAAEAVACRNGEWGVTFAVVSAPTAEYVPSGGGDAMTAYLEDIGASSPLAGESEVKALAEASR